METMSRQRLAQDEIAKCEIRSTGRVEYGESRKPVFVDWAFTGYGDKRTVGVSASDDGSTRLLGGWTLDELCDIAAVVPEGTRIVPPEMQQYVPVEPLPY